MTNNKTVKLIVEALSSKKAEDIKIIEVGNMTSVADYFVICSGRNTTQVKALYEGVEDHLNKQANLSPRRFEGVTEGRWIAIDYIDVVVHIFHKEAREMYQLDMLWDNGSNVTSIANND